MQDKPLFNQFIAFCESQPEDKKIDHSSWRSCAVGKFADSVGITDEYLSVSFVPELLGTYPANLYKKLDLGDCPNTYGEFTKFLKAFV